MADSPLYATINGIRVAYDRTGDGFGLLLMHGFPRTRRTWTSNVGGGACQNTHR